MKKSIILYIGIIGWFFFLSTLIEAQTLKSTEQLVFILNSFNGKGYEGGFVPQSEDTIYLLADHDNAISATITMVYHWPITGRYEASLTTMNKGVEGTLEILKDEKIIQTLEKEDNSLHYLEGYLGEATVLYKGEEARDSYGKFKNSMEEYYRDIAEYYKVRTEYEKNINEFFKEIKRRRDRGEKLGEEDIKKIIPQEPELPTLPISYTTPPRKDYIINLPVGRYKIKLRSEDGTIVQGSEKNLIVFTSRRTGKIGYEIIPEDRWTKRESWKDPNSVLYNIGKETIYLRPFIQNEYNELYYNKLIDPQSKGREKNWIWVNIKPIEDVTLLFLEGRRIIRKITSAPYYVKQAPTPDLGYEIIEFNPEEMTDKSPSFEGYKLELTTTQNKRNYEVIIKKGGEILQGSNREIRILRKKSSYTLFIISIYPLILGFVASLIKKQLRW